MDDSIRRLLGGLIVVRSWQIHFFWGMHELSIRLLPAKHGGYYLLCMQRPDYDEFNELYRQHVPGRQVHVIWRMLRLRRG